MKTKQIFVLIPESYCPTHQVRHICKAHKADTQKPAWQKSLPCANTQATLCGATQTHIIADREEGRTYNRALAQYGLTEVFYFSKEDTSQEKVIVYRNTKLLLGE